jgi:hypothetical protein
MVFSRKKRRPNMSLDQAPNPKIETNDGGKYANFGGQQQTELGKTANVQTNTPDQTSELVKNGVLPNTHVHDPAKIMWGDRQASASPGEALRAYKDGVNHGDGRHDGPGEGHRPGGHHGGGGHHERPEEKLMHAAVHALSPDEKMKFKAEDGAAHQYHSEMFAWKRSGKTGPEPTKPDIPEHDKVAAKVKADKETIEAQVKQSMPAQEQTALDQARVDYKGAVAGAGTRKGVPIPEELADYNRRIAKATREYVGGKES